MAKPFSAVFERMDCVCIHTDDLAASLACYGRLGMREAWKLDRVTAHGIPWSLVGLDFPDSTSSQLTLSTHPDRRGVEVEIRVADVREAHRALAADPEITWIAEPFAIENGHVAVMRAPDGNLFVLVGG
jgi:catechol 2,3-dioxygenase-like lactoylglutathione lyase family enzyme